MVDRIALTTVSTALEARWEKGPRAQGEEKADMLASIATGRGTPIGPLAEEWLEVKSLQAPPAN